MVAGGLVAEIERDDLAADLNLDDADHAAEGACGICRAIRAAIAHDDDLEFSGPRILQK